MTLATTSRPASRRRAPFVIGAVAAAALVFGGAGVAFASDSSTDTSSDSSTSMERPAHDPRMHGTVVSNDGSTITITDHNGFTRTILVTSDTAYTDDLTADLTAGTEIHATGTVNSNGTSLDATTIGGAPTPPANGGPGMGGPGKGGPGHGPLGDRSNDSDSSTDDSADSTDESTTESADESENS